MAGIKINEAAYAQATAAERAEIDALIGRLSGVYEDNPLETYIPYEKQIAFHTAPERTRMFVAGNRAGKSHAGAADDLIQALPPDLVPKRFHPYKRYGWDEPFKGRIITPDLTFTMEAILEKFRQLTPRQALKGGEWESAFDKTKRILSFKRGDRLDFMSFEQDPDKFGGVDLHRIHCDEEPSGPNSWKIYRDSRMRLIDHGGDMIFTMTPLFGLSWVHDLLWDKRYTKDDIFGVQASMRDNPHLATREIDQALSMLSGEERRAVENGEFTHFEGKFYPEFTDAYHVVKPPTLEMLSTMDIVVGIDPGLKRTGVIFCAFDNDNSCLAFAEIYETDWLPPQVAEEIKRLCDRWNLKDPRYVIDPSARVRATVNAEQIEAEYAREGIYAEHGQNARGPGILEVKSRLQKGTLVVSKECRNLLWEFPRYRKDEGHEDEFAAIKQDDHLLDALRYVIMARTWEFPMTRQKTHHFNNNPNFEPPWRGPRPQPTPPLGSFS